MHYRFYCVNLDDSFASGHDAEHSSDREALDAACAMVAEAHAVEVWTGTRFVGRLANASDVAPWSVSSHLPASEKTGEHPD